MKSNDFKGTKLLFKLALRRDRIKLPLWIAGIAGTITLITRLYNDFSFEEMKEILAMAAMSPGMRLMVAPVAEYGDNYLGQFLLLRMSLIIAVLVGLMSIQLIMRHTRANEETGCQELIASSVTGKYAPLLSGLMLAGIANLLTGVLMAAGFMANSLDFAGAFAAGLSFSLLGFMFAAIAALCAQIQETSKGCAGIAYLIMAFMFGINSVGNAIAEVNPGDGGFESSGIVLLSPLGWVQQIHAFTENNIVFFIPLAALGLVFAFAGFALINKRDIGRGIVQGKSGRKNAPAWMKNPFGLAFRLHRKTFIAWAIPLLAFGAIFGGASQEYSETVENMEMFAELQIAGEMFLFALTGVFAAVITIYTMQTILRMRAEEAGGPLENLLSTPVKRPVFALSHILVAFIGSVLLIFIFAMSLALTTDDVSGVLTDYLKTVFSQGAGIVLTGSLIVLIYGILPKLSGLLSGLVILVAIGFGPFFGAMLDVPKTLMNLSPFNYVSTAPADFSAPQTVLVYLVALAITVAGVGFFSRRNMQF